MAGKKVKQAEKTRMGRPPKVGARPRVIRITDEVAEFYRRAGDGNLTLGIERVAAKAPAC